MPTCSKGCRWPDHANTWAHCGTCHSTFMTVTLFDAHRTGGQCWRRWKVEKIAASDTKTSLTLTFVDGVWGTPEGHHNRQVLGERLKNARSRKGA